jgi:rubrerythrin
MSPQSEMDINSIEEFLAHAHAMEREASDQYAELAEQMEVHNNPEVAELFAKLSAIEGKHVQKINEKADGRELPHLAPWDFKWQDGVAPENPAALEAHYLMTPHHALSLALKAEEQAADFFRRVAESTTNDQVRSMAEEMAADEIEHIAWLKEWLEKFPEPEEDWDHDHDPPMLQE